MNPTLFEEIKRAYAEADCLATQADVDAALDRMADAITARLQDSNPLIYAVMNGGLIVAGQLIARLNFPLETAYLHATRYGHALNGNLLDWRVRPTQDLQDRTVLVIDDILDEGHTLAAICANLQQEGAREVLTAVLVHKRHERKATPGMRADFTGMDIADRFLFGCGMDYKGYWRNAPGIFALKGH
ncbi:MAG: hypoxanthine-guanine phosphoribosyltransferase [Rhodocyclaceae bacterium]|jgi:hypoxanthine phosphoribosyltransferase|nr:hypoxanthine-guanine phosphoribosyltransferase [Rhodocyclaceae bacterium]MDO9602369.1 hypoxanthine-guanine phosphoribosyltransferase [Rhodocyclaceae bacterium]MDP2194368.1 hypoxanthine-guanine phosphoribosyltransferase [Rhodocyclaceae bacterium]